MPVRRINKGEKTRFPVKGGYFNLDPGTDGLLFVPTADERVGIFVSDAQLEEMGYVRKEEAEDG